MKPLSINELEKKLIRDVRPFYLKTDKAHRIDHILEVMSNVSIICFKLRRMDCLWAAMVAAAYHDIHSTKVLREVHHLHSFSHVLDNRERFMKRYGLSHDELTNAAYACLEHRNSWEGGYNSIVSEIVAAADRGYPKTGEMPNLLKRAYLFGREKGYSVRESQNRAIGVLEERLGRGKMGAVPEWYYTVFEKELDLRWREIANLDTNVFTPELTLAWEEELSLNGE